MPELRVMEYNHTLIIYIVKDLNFCSRFTEVEINCMDNFLRTTIRLARSICEKGKKNILCCVLTQMLRCSTQVNLQSMILYHVRTLFSPHHLNGNLIMPICFPSHVIFMTI
jgi:hypothetical protein